jgi:hypothetical protein
MQVSYTEWDQTRLSKRSQEPSASGSIMSPAGVSQTLSRVQACTCSIVGTSHHFEFQRILRRVVPSSFLVNRPTTPLRSVSTRVPSGKVVTFTSLLAMKMLSPLRCRSTRAGNWSASVMRAMGRWLRYPVILAPALPAQPLLLCNFTDWPRACILPCSVQG